MRGREGGREGGRGGREGRRGGGREGEEGSYDCVLVLLCGLCGQKVLGTVAISFRRKVGNGMTIGGRTVEQGWEEE